MKLTAFDGYLKPTFASDGAGKFHPALHHNLGVYYWPNIKVATAGEASNLASKAVNDALEAANTIITGWNLLPIGERL